MNEKQINTSVIELQEPTLQYGKVVGVLLHTVLGHVHLYAMLQFAFVLLPHSVENVTCILARTHSQSVDCEPNCLLLPAAEIETSFAHAQ